MNRRALVIIVLIIVIGALGFRMAQQGKIQLPQFLSQVSLPTNTSSTINNETRTIVQEENSYISVFEKTSPSVIAIGVNQRIINPFDPTALPRNQQSTIGTGFIASNNGVIVTNKHVVADTNTQYTVVTKEGKKLEIKKIYRDPNLDLALVQVENPSLSALELADSTKLQVGQIAIAIGNALGRFDNTMTTGVVSGLGRAVNVGDPFLGETEHLDDLIQTDAAINPGNSGGPLLNSAGQVIGVNVATTEGAQNIGFAIPINAVKAMVEEFTRTGTIQRAFLGIRYRVVTRDVAILNEVPQGAYIEEVVPGSPAEKAGVKAGDIVTKIEGKAISQDNVISELVQSKKIGDAVSLDIWSDGQTRTLSVTLTEAPNQ